MKWRSKVPVNLSVKSVLFALFLPLLFSCGNKDEEEAVQIPSGVLTEEQYTKLLIDLSLAESAPNVNVKNVPTAKFDSVYAFDPLKENGVSKAVYDSSISFYSHHPKLYKKIYDEVLLRLSDMQTERQKIKKDSGQVKK